MTIKYLTVSPDNKHTMHTTGFIDHKQDDKWLPQVCALADMLLIKDIILHFKPAIYLLLTIVLGNYCIGEVILVGPSVIHDCQNVFSHHAGLTIITEHLVGKGARERL